MKKIIRPLLTALILASSLSLSVTGVALAKDNNGQKSLVALGDSITYGYNLGVNNQHPSKDAFPSIIGQDGHLRVRNLAEPGWTTEDLLAALSTEKYQQALKHADYVTLDIGSNDLLRALKLSQETNVDLYNLLVNDTLPTLKNNLATSIIEIRKHTRAPIIVYNIYNPFRLDTPQNIALHRLSDQLLPSFVNPLISTTVQQLRYQGVLNVIIADAYTAFEIAPNAYIRENDIHPTEAGQEVLANIGKELLNIE